MSASTNKANETLKPEFLRINDAVRVFAVGRSKLYEMISAGEIKSVSLRRRGMTRGTRLIVADSLRNFLNSKAA